MREEQTDRRVWIGLALLAAFLLLALAWPPIFNLGNASWRVVGLRLSASLALILACVVLVRTASFKSRQPVVEPAQLIAIDEEQAAERLAGAIRIPTVSHQEHAKINYEAFLAFHAYLKRSFPLVHAKLEPEVVGDYSLLYTWKGKDERLRPILLLAHMDVVPMEPGTEGDWAYPAFAGTIAEGYVWGRGAMDMKLAVTGILEAVEALLSESCELQRTVYLAFGHDEEMGGRRGAAQIASLLEKRNVVLEYVLDEGLVVTEGIVPGVSGPVALIGVAEKGYVSVELTAECGGGHSSYPPPQTSVGIISDAVRKLERHQRPANLSGPVRFLFEYVGPEMSLVNRIVFANLWLFGGLVLRKLATSPTTNASIRTTTAATMIQGGVKDNVLPEMTRAVVNYRIRLGESIAVVLNHVRTAIADPRVAVRIVGELVSEPSPQSSIEAPSFATLTRTIRQVLPDAIVAPGLVIVATDSRHFARLTENTYRFLPQRLGPADLRRPHGTNERISVGNYAEIVQFYAQLIRNSS